MSPKPFRTVTVRDGLLFLVVVCCRVSLLVFRSRLCGWARAKQWHSTYISPAQSFNHPSFGILSFEIDVIATQSTNEISSSAELGSCARRIHLPPTNHAMEDSDGSA